MPPARSVAPATFRTPSVVAAPSPRAPFAHLNHLGFGLRVRGEPVEVVALYANAPDYRHAASPGRDGYEGVACVDDAGRAAVAYLEHYETTRDPEARSHAVGLLRFVSKMEQGNGEYVNFVYEGGKPNRTTPTSEQGFSFWAGRALWSLGEAARVLGPKDPEVVAMRPVLDRTVGRLARTVDGGRLVPGTRPGSEPSATATAEALLGLLAYERADPSPERADLARNIATTLARATRPGVSNGAHAPPWGARLDEPGATWHAWGARTTEALAVAGMTLKNPALVSAARVEADHLWGRFLASWSFPAEILPNGEVHPFPQIAYGISPIVRGYLALSAATGDKRYSIAAGLTSAWFHGANEAGAEMYDPATGRTFDGIAGPSTAQVNRNSGAESTVEGALALRAVAQDPVAAHYATFRPVGPMGQSLADAPARRVFVGPNGERVALVREGTSFRFEELR